MEIQNLTEIVYAEERPKLDDDLQRDLDELITVKNRTRIAACMLIIRTNLTKGNKQVVAVLKDTKHDKEKTYDRIVAMMLDNCYNNIDRVTIENVLRPESINKWDEQYDKLLEFNKNVFQIIGPELKYTPGEKWVLDEIAHVAANPSIEIVVEEEKVDFFTEKLGKYKYIAYGMGIGFVLSFIFITLYSLVLKKNIK